LAAASAASPAYAQARPTMLEETVDGPYALAGTLHVADPQALSLQIFIDWQDDQNHYRIAMTPLSTVVERVVDGQATAIGRTRVPGVLEADADLELTVRRDGWRIELILARQVLARAWDAELPFGPVGYTVAGGDVPDAMLQPLGGVYMTDDFMRAADAQSTWEPVSGKWETQSLRTDEQRDRMEADKSANAFSYFGSSPDGPGIACSGYWFWSNYAVTAAVRPVETDPLGLVAYFQDPDNYLAVRWTSALSDAEDADLLQLLSVIDGQRAVLTQASGGHIPGQWYALQLRICDGVLQVLVDDEPRLAAEADLFGQGQPGLYCEGPGGAFFDSVKVEEWTVLLDDFEEPAAGRWVQASGTWQRRDGHLRGTGVTLTGRPQWERYCWAADLFADGSAAVGVVAGADDQAIYALRIGVQGCGLDYEGQAQIVRIAGDAVEVLSSAPAHLPAGTWHRARLVADDGLLTGYLDGKRVLDAWHAGARAGRPGLYAEGPDAGVFDDARLDMLPPMRIARVAKEFSESDQHPEMVEWASTRAPWLTPDGEGGTWWTKGDYLGDKTVEFEIPNVGRAAGEVRLRLDASPEDQSAGLTLVIATQQGSKTLTATLLDGEETVAEGSVEVQSNPCPVTVERKGTWVVATLDGTVAFSEKR
ncbi:MAG: hypothetical protein U9R79_12175, partial [Armatimonadota bacterium]|nr:hypothetical protein [Armatimonadota bacterium]